MAATSEKKDGEEIGGTFLVGYEGRLFNIYSDFQVEESTLPYNACGCGEDIALGVLHFLHHFSGSPEAKPERALKCALEAAEAHSSGVRGPFHIVSAGNYLERLIDVSRLTDEPRSQWMKGGYVNQTQKKEPDNE